MGVLRALGNRKEKCDISHYHGSKTSGSQQSFLTDTTVCIVEQWMKSIGYGFVPAASMHKKVTRHFFIIICKTMVCLDPEILLPWQYDNDFSLQKLPSVHCSTIYIFLYRGVLKDADNHAKSQYSQNQ